MAVLPNGRRRILYGLTREEAARKLMQTLHDRDTGDLVAAQRLTVATFLDQWLQASRNSVRPMTYRSYEGTVRRHLVSMVGWRSLQKLTPNRSLAQSLRL